MAGGCGAATVDLHAAFASIQVDEARIEHASLALDQTRQSPDGSADAEEICAASEHLCATARPTGDRDALARCARSEERCTQARAEAAR